MMIRLKLFASLAKHLPAGADRNEIDCELPDGASVSDAIRHCGVPSAHCHLVLVNGHYVAPSERDGRILTDGQALAIWPPVAGG